jgi:hypothetical protein
LSAVRRSVIHPEQLPGSRWRGEPQDKDGIMTLARVTMGIDVSKTRFDVFSAPSVGEGDAHLEDFGDYGFGEGPWRLWLW